MSAQFWFGFAAAYGVSIFAFAVLVLWDRLQASFVCRRARARWFAGDITDDDFVARIRPWEGQL